MAQIKGKKEKRVKPELPGGFRDYAPADAIQRSKMIQTIRKTFEDFGFDPLETPAVERTEVLTGGEKESGKIIFTVRGSRESFGKAQDKKADSSLRFDLTVPLARFISANPEIPKPFKRYQIGSVWRGESPQAGRYREFMQADVDIVGASRVEADAEIIAVFYNVLKNLGLSNFRIKMNSRKILNGLPAYAGFLEKKLFGALRIIDKKDKSGDSGVKKELEKEFGEKISEKIIEFIKNPQVAADGKSVKEGLSDLETIFSTARGLGVEESKMEIDYSVVRGLGYYTGFVFEVVFPEVLEIGSILAGGRYDNLVLQFTGQPIPAVGASLGVDRLYAALEKLGVLKKKRTTVRALLLNLSPKLKDEYIELLRDLRAANVNASFYLGDDRAFQAQLSYAVKMEIGYVIMYGDVEKAKGVFALKNLVTREQREVRRDELIKILKGN
ncbi:MAG: histidine--tRNA ligase [Candidatus Sungbacteria bacterium RIFCSPHIGHO2_01_FULL_50_25]|uniref:Histidine--tRNA ligase n=1 Tax=Candidatus Sungbacteria bacterium RIFCSPHIGHO2_01_FULL_50_25 TaxID=1802265 RepID=A0A1G2KAL8_9BACT|nr:MAG: histidine--tRNA ligase [Candidatus Sungbacteria bacterium RIFCSPHIGHO2_01_FULL_50_25]